jgi:hypothetical protein
MTSTAQLGLNSSDTVSALGLRWAALRGMLASPLIEADEQQSLRAELLDELAAIQRDLALQPARNRLEVIAKIDIVQTALRQAGLEDAFAQLLDSVKTDTLALISGARTRTERPRTAHLVRSPTWAVEPAGVGSAPEEVAA